MKTTIDVITWRKINMALACGVVMAEDLIKIHNRQKENKPERELYSRWLEEVEEARRVLRENLSYGQQ
jgi:hypothetical protein